MINLSKNNLADVKAVNTVQASLKANETEGSAVLEKNSGRTEVEDITNPEQLSKSFKINFKKIGKSILKFLKAVLIEGAYYERDSNGNVYTNLW